MSLKRGYTVPRPDPHFRTILLPLGAYLLTAAFAAVTGLTQSYLAGAATVLCAFLTVRSFPARPGHDLDAGLW